MKKEARQRNNLPDTPIVTLWLLNIYTHPCDDVAFGMVLSVRDYCFPNPHNLQRKIWNYQSQGDPETG